MLKKRSNAPQTRRLSRVLMLLIVTLVSLVVTQNGYARSSSGQVVFLRGIFGVFSTGLNDMSDQLNKDGISSQVFHHANWRDAAEHILATRSRKRRRLVVVGHSLGANAAVQLSGYLKGRGVKVDYLITLDPTIRQSVPRNVRRTLNYYLPQSVWGKGLYVSRGSRGRLTNVQLATTSDFGHFSMDSDAQLKAAILSGVRSALRGRRPRPRKHRHTLKRVVTNDAAR